MHAASVNACCVFVGAAAKVLLACDTRPSSPALLAAAAAGVRALGGVAVDCGRLTTPQLHWQLRRLNQGLPWALQDYFETLAGAYEQLVKGTHPLEQVSPLYSAFMTNLLALLLPNLQAIERRVLKSGRCWFAPQDQVSHASCSCCHRTGFEHHTNCVQNISKQKQGVKPPFASFARVLTEGRTSS